MTATSKNEVTAEAQEWPRCVRDACAHINMLLAPLGKDWSVVDYGWGDDEDLSAQDDDPDFDAKEYALDLERARLQGQLADLYPVRSPWEVWINHQVSGGTAESRLRVTSAKRNLPITYADITAAVQRLVGRVMVEKTGSTT